MNQYQSNRSLQHVGGTSQGTQIQHFHNDHHYQAQSFDELGIESTSRHEQASFGGNIEVDLDQEALRTLDARSIGEMQAQLTSMFQ